MLTGLKETTKYKPIYNMSKCLKYVNKKRIFN